MSDAALPPPRLLAALIAPLFLSALAAAQDGPPGAGAPIAISVDENKRVKGLHYDATLPGQAAAFAFSVSLSAGSTTQYVHWKIDGEMVTAAEGSLSCPYKAVGVGKHTITVKLAANGGGLYNGSLTFAAIGGPLGLGVGGAESGLSTPSHDLNGPATAEDPTKAWYLQYFGYDRNGGVPSGYQSNQFGSVAPPSQLSGTTFAYTVDAGLTQMPFFSGIFVFPNGANLGNSLEVHCTFTYNDGQGLSGSAQDDSYKTPPPGTTTPNASYYKFSVHNPSTLTSVRTRHEVAPPGYNPGVIDEYTMTLKDTQGMLMPSVWITERFSSIEFLPGPTPGTWTTAGIGASCGTFVDNIWGNSATLTAYPKPGSDLNSFIQKYYAATKITTSSSSVGLLVGTYSVIVWTNDTQHQLVP